MLMIDDEDLIECTGGDKLEEDLEYFELSGSLSLQDDDMIKDLCKEDADQKQSIKVSSNQSSPDVTSPPPDQRQFFFEQVDTSQQEEVTAHHQAEFHDYSQEYSQRELKRRPHECSICHKRFIRKNHLNTHLMIHTGERNHVCTVCGKRFRQLSHLRSHIQLHSRDEQENSLDSQSLDYADDSVTNLPSTSSQNGDNSGSLSYQEILLQQVAYNERKRIERDLKPRPYECHVCRKRFIRRNHLTTHLMIHSGERKHLCTICGRRFRQLSHLKTHSFMHCAEKQFTCGICQKQFVSSGALKRHQVIHLNDFKCHCHICGKGFHQTNHLSGHYQVHYSKMDTSKNNFNTAVTSQPLSNMAHTNNGHTVSQDEIKSESVGNNSDMSRGGPYQCNQCYKYFTSKSSLSQHLLIHGDVRRYQCSTCGKRFRQKVHLTTHMLLHTGQRNFKCDVCGKSFFQKCTLIGHQLCHFGEKKHHCHICGKSFLRKNALNRHKRIHTRQNSIPPKKSEGITEVFVPYSTQTSMNARNEAPASNLSSNSEARSQIKSEVAHVSNELIPPDSIGLNKAAGPTLDNADKQFSITNHSNVSPGIITSGKVHQMKPMNTACTTITANGRRMFQCDQCLKCFSRKDAVKQHQLIHLDIRRFECSTCHRKFRQLSHLKSHELLHSNEKNYECFVCKKRFRLLSHLKNHSIIHMGIRKFQCPNCGNKFFRRSHLKRHLLIHVRKGEEIQGESLDWRTNISSGYQLLDTSVSKDSFPVKSESQASNDQIQYEPVFPGFHLLPSVKPECSSEENE